jgi:hypothetical protein
LWYWLSVAHGSEPTAGHPVARSARQGRL